MSEDQIIGLIITIAAVVAITTGLVWLFVFGIRPEWPEGIRSEATYRGHRAIVVWHESYRPNSTDRESIALQVAKAAWVTGRAWREKKGDNVFGDLETVGAWILADGAFEEEAAKAHPGRDPLSIAAWLGKGMQRLGNGPPMPIMRESHVDHLERTGQPAIHELLHSLGGLYHDRAHADASVWADPANPEISVEERAQELFDIVAELGPGEMRE